MYKTLPIEDDEQRKARVQKEAREILKNFKGEPSPKQWEEVEEFCKENPGETIEQEPEEEIIEEQNPIKRVYKKVIKKVKKGRK